MKIKQLAKAMARAEDKGNILLMIRSNPRLDIPAIGDALHLGHGYTTELILELQYAGEIKAAK